MQIAWSGTNLENKPQKVIDDTSTYLWKLETKIEKTASKCSDEKVKQIR